MVGNTSTAVAASKPARNAHDPRKALSGLSRRRPTATEPIPASATISANQASGLIDNASYIWRSTIAVATVTTGQSTATDA